MKTVEDIIAHISEKPWSAYTEADYTLEQYAAACLVAPPKDQLTSKAQCKLPVKTPNGALSRAGVHAAAAALAGARGGVKLSDEERSSAEKKLQGYYKQLGETAPDSLSHADSTGGAMVNTTAAIMALPAPLESIRLVGDEDKHTTLLYFGETNTLPDDAKQTLVDSVKLASSMLFPFSEAVRDVSRLGADSPPALVAMLSDRNLSQVRNLFIMNPSIKSYLDNTQQFPSFTPHMTLAYPDYADEVILRTLMRQVYRVNFDRLAVWWNDERIEFPLSLMVEGDSMAMSDAIGEFLEHHGVKGQKWGVTKSSSSSTGKSSPKRPQLTVDDNLTTFGHKLIARAGKDKTYWKRAAAITGVGLVGTAAAITAPALLPASVVAGAGGSAAVTGKIALGTFTARMGANVHNYTSYLKRVKAGTTDPFQLKHDNISSSMTVGEVFNGMTQKQKDAAAAITASVVKGIDPSNNSYLNNAWATMTSVQKDVVSFLTTVAQSKNMSVQHTIDTALEHHGVKGQKWGVRRAVDSATGLVKRRGGSAAESDTLSGLKPRTSSEDQIHQDRIAAKIAKSGSKSLSNKDIQDYTRRLQLQQDLSKALASQSAAEKAKADGFIKRTLKSQGSRQFDRVLNKATDVAVEAALKQIGVKTKSPGIEEVAKRLKPKKK